MNVARVVGFSIGDHIILRESSMILKVHTISDIMTLGDIKMKKGPSRASWTIIPPATGGLTPWSGTPITPGS